MIVFYRDGVSEGEYAQVAQQEVQAINSEWRCHSLLHNAHSSAISQMPCSTTELWRRTARKGAAGLRSQSPSSSSLLWARGMDPKTVVAFLSCRLMFCQAPHTILPRESVRLASLLFIPATANFSGDSDHADSSGNCPPGFVVDDQITNAVYPDFYLQSHSGIQGSKSSASCVAFNDNTGPVSVQRVDPATTLSSRTSLGRQLTSKPIEVGHGGPHIKRAAGYKSYRSDCAMSIRAPPARCPSRLPSTVSRHLSAAVKDRSPFVQTRTYVQAYVVVYLN